MNPYNNPASRPRDPGIPGAPGIPGPAGSPGAGSGRPGGLRGTGAGKPGEPTPVGAPRRPPRPNPVVSPVGSTAGAAAPLAGRPVRASTPRLATRAAATVPAAGAWRPPRLRRPQTEGRLLLIAGLLSLLFHGVLLASLFDRHFGRLDTAGLGLDEGVYRVYREDVADEIMDDVPVGSPDAADATANAAGGHEPANTAAALSGAMLGNLAPPNAPPPGGQAGERGDAPVAIRGVEDRRGPDPGAPASSLAPEIALPPSLANRVLTGPTIEVPFVAGDGSTATAAGTPGASGGDEPSAGGGLSAADQALAMLTNPGPRAPAGGRPGSPGTSSPPFGVPGSMERPKPPDVRPDLPPKPPTTPATPLPVSIPVVPPTGPGASGEAVPAERLDEDFDYVVSYYDPTPGQTGGENRGYYKVDIVPKRTLRKLRTMPRDVVFVLDTSESIAPEWVKESVWGVQDALGAMNPEDRFNVVLFKEQTEVFSPGGNQPATEENVAAAKKFLEAARSSGSTDVNQALQRLLVRDLAIERVYDLVFISDGVPTKGVMDTREMINLITRNNDLVASIYCVGIGHKQNHELLQYLAYRNKGFCLFADQAPKASEAIRGLASRLRYPIMKDVRMIPAGVDAESIYPRELPNIHQGETLSIYGRSDGKGEFTMDLVGHNGQKPLGFTFKRDFSEAKPGDRPIAYNWAFWKLHHLYSQMLRSGSTDDIRRQIDELRQRYGLKTLY